MRILAITLTLLGCTADRIKQGKASKIGRDERQLIAPNNPLGPTAYCKLHVRIGFYSSPMPRRAPVTHWPPRFRQPW
jgi:hypothetical protein